MKPRIHAAALLALAGINPPARAQIQPLDVNIVSHQDDDIFFLQPDIFTSYRSGHAQVTVFLTGGNVQSDDLHYLHQREQGAMDAYAEMALIAAGRPPGTSPVGVHWNVWNQQYGAIKATAADCVEYPGIHLVFLRMRASAHQDGSRINVSLSGTAVSPIPNLDDLYNKANCSVTSVDQSTFYTKAVLTNTLKAILRNWKPSIVRTLDVNATQRVNGVLVPRAGTIASYGNYYDHLDHYWGARFAQDALNAYWWGTAPSLRGPLPQYIAYRGYNIFNDPTCVITDQSLIDVKRWMSYYYALGDFHMHVAGSGRPGKAYGLDPMYRFEDWMADNPATAFGIGTWATHQARMPQALVP